MSKKNKNIINVIPEKKLVMWFKIVIITLTMVFYYNTTFNYFSMDDFYVNTDDQFTKQGISGIPDIFTNLYGSSEGVEYGYRPIVKLTYALEYQFTADYPWNPYISHFINILLYIVALLILYMVLRRIFKNYNPWFPFLIVLLFMAHPAHTEVVASLKNRDMLLNFIFSFSAIWHFLKWADTSKTRFLITGIFLFILALLSKGSALAQLAVFPLILYFFTDLKPKKIIAFTISTFVIVAGFLIFRSMMLPEASRTLTRLFENPLIQVNNPIIRLSTSFYVLGFYLKQMFVPFPLLYYYGYNMIPVVGWTNPWALLSLATYLAMLVIAIKGLKSKSFLSFIIIYFFINISMYANIVMLVPGIVADRFLLFPTISSSALIIWILFKLFGVNTELSQKRQIKTRWISLIVILIIIPSGYYVHVRNTQWRTQYSLYKADMPRLWNSVKANNLYAHEIMNQVNAELAKPVNPYKFIKGAIDRADKHYKRAVELDSTHYPTWNNLGTIYSKIHGNQAMIRNKSYLERNDTIKALQEEKNAEKYFNTAISYFKKAIKYKPDYGSAYFNLANTFELQNNYDSSIVYFQKAADVDGGTIYSMSRLANAYYQNHNVGKAVEINMNIIDKYPDDDMPLINLGNYAVNVGDTATAVDYFSRAFELSHNENIARLLSSYYQSRGDNKRASYYIRMSQPINNKK